ncbi:MAG: Rne/Rng family ribonuclease [Proteobacteria bacterium]|nr:Rne/Rng family ribonuclease [Pseudomonadota bacterium]MCP4921882.1 Rne/Rng family ribonuclease [Pseudomonadota bacterium]
MSSEIIVNKTGRELRVAQLENGQLSECHIDRGRDRGYVGNVYKGRVVRVLPGMQAAFVDIGLERAAFLYVGDIYPEFLDMPNRQPTSPEETVVEETPREKPRAGQPAIQDLLKEGQEIVAQVAKDPIGTKGARITTHVTLPGRYIVFMPTVEHVGISRRIEKDKERRRLRDFVEKHRPKGAGFIVRTVCANQPDDVLQLDMDYLLKTWKKVQVAATEGKAPRLLHADYGLVLRFLRDNLSEKIDRIVVDDRDEFELVQGFMSDFMPSFKERVQLYRGKEPVFDVYGVEVEVNRSLGRKVWLKSGGYLVIDQTEALTAIDINSGKFVGKSSLEDTTTQINLEAVSEIVHQLRLRNIGGIVIIDFIDMDKESNRNKVYRALEEEVKKDKARTNVLKISELGLVEMTRKRVQEDLTRFLTEDCFYCEGNGHLRARETLCFDIFREAQREAHRSQNRETIYVNAHPRVADLLYGAEFESLDAFEHRLNKKIVVRAMGHFHLERFEVYSR